jgi:hypothetical protein
MKDKSISEEKRKSVYTEGKQAFDASKLRGYNPYAASNLELTVSWWHGWDTAEEESKGVRLPIAGKL